GTQAEAHVGVSGPAGAVKASTPARMMARPAIWPRRSGSPSRRNASSTANTGARLPSEPVITAPSRRLAAKVMSVAAAGKNRPTAAKIGSAVQTGDVPGGPNGAAATNNSGEGGMLVAAPGAGDTSGRPNCGGVSPGP